MVIKWRRRRSAFLMSTDFDIRIEGYGSDSPTFDDRVLGFYLEFWLAIESVLFHPR